MRKFTSVLFALVVIASMLAACAAPTPAPTSAPAEPTAVPVAKFKACQVTDVGGIDDKSFNATAWKGVQDAMTEYGIEGKYLESTQQTDYEKNINAFIEEKCDLVISVGFLLGDATAAAATANPDQKFGIVDFGYDPVFANVRGSGFAIDQATFLAGYLAAGMTKTGKVGTYGGLQIPPVTAFMDGFFLGVTKYNEVNGTKVEVLGWDPTAQAGLFTGDFSNLDNGKKTTESLLDEGADIIMPVAGPVGQGTLAALKERNTGLMIGVDNDWSVFYTDYTDFILASALKNMDLWVKDTIKMAMDGTLVGENYLGNLANNGVGLAIGKGFEGKIDAALIAEIDGLKAEIIAGSIDAGDVEAVKVELGTPENPLIMAQAPSATTQELITGGEAVAAKLSEITGYTIKVVVPNSYAALVEAMGSGNAHIGWLPTFGYMLAKEKGYADVALAVIRAGSDHYGAQFIAHVDSGFTAYFDPATNTNTADAATALAQFKDKKPCWTDPLSVSGYIIPLGFIKNLGIPLKAGAFVQGHPTVVTAVYSKGICDFGATFIDARTNKGVNEAHPDVQEKVVVVWRTDPVIPNDNVSIAVDLPAEIKDKVVAALVEISSTEEGRALLKAGGYDVEGLKPVDDTFYDEFRVYLQASGIDVTTLYPK